MEIGIDIEENDRFNSLSEAFIKRTYTESEIEHAKNSKNINQRFCAMWCAKESVIKALSNKKLVATKIEIKTDDQGKPYVVKNEDIINALKKCGATEIKISLSHTKNYSTAVCLIY